MKLDLSLSYFKNLLNFWKNTSSILIIFGDVHNPDTASFSEQLIRPNQSGAIGFISTIKQGFIPFINNYTENLYEMISKFGYHKTIGQQMVMTLDSLDVLTSSTYWGPKFEGNYNGMSLQGDPALRLNSHAHAELLIEENNIWTTPSTVNLSNPDFDLNIIINNLGKAISDSIYMEIKQIFPDGTDTIYSKLIGGVKNRDTIIFKIINIPEKSIGQNVFNISIDLPLSFIVEAEDEINNNQVIYSINISIISNVVYWFFTTL